jgi:hypothetical protein
VGKIQADWRHMAAAGILLALLLGLLWKLMLGSTPPAPTAPVPKGRQPIAASPDSP